MEKLNGWCWDIEGDELYLFCTKVWYIRLKALDGSRSIKLYPFKSSKQEVYAQYMKWVESFDDGALVVGHNILGYDAFVMWKLFGIKPVVGKNGKDFIEGKHIQFIDTLYLSQFYEPDRMSHSLETLSRGNKAEKIDYRQSLINAGVIEKDSPKGSEFKLYHYPLTDEYCDADCDANIEVFFDLVSGMKELYKDDWITPAFRMGQKAFFLMNAQSFTGVSFDIDAATVLRDRITIMVEEIKEEVLPKLPLRNLKKGEEKDYTLCSKPFKKNGDLSSHADNFITKHSGIKVAENIYNFYGRDYPLVGGMLLDVKLPMELKDQMDFKEYLMSEGWVPTMYNLQKDSNGKIMRDENKKVIKTSPKLQEQGKLCPNLEAMENPIIKEVVRYLSIKNRLGVLEGWLKNPRLAWDGRLSAGSSGITSTHRQKHVSICNVAKVGSMLGEEMRSLFKCEEGMAFVGADSAQLENRVTAFYTKKYDGGVYADIILNGDSHSHNAKAFFPKETMNFDPHSPTHDKDHKDFKKYRGKAKNGLYCLLYGGQAAKLAQTLGIPDREGKKAFEAFWNANPALRDFRDAVTNYWKTTGKSQFLPAIDGRLLRTRSPHSLVNQICQSAGAIATDLALIYFDGMMGGLQLDEKGRPYYNYKGCIVKRVLYQHDEVQVECSPEVAEEVGKIFVDCIKKAGVFLKMTVELDGEYKIDKNWCGTH
jgi:hypothetical protein